MAVLKPSKPNTYRGNMLREGLRLLLDAATPAAAGTMGFIATASLPTSGIIEMGTFDGIELIYAGDALTTDLRVRVTGIVPVLDSSSTLAGYLEYIINSEAGTCGMSTLVLGAAFGTAIGAAASTATYLWGRTPATSSPMQGVTAYAAEAASIGSLRITPLLGTAFIRVQATAITGGTKVSVFCRRLKGDSLNN